MYQKPAKKSLGQHFLHDVYYLDQILHVIAPSPQDTFIEVGPGCGYLTDLLVPQCQHMTAIELDRDCVDFLKKKYAHEPRVSIVQGDVLAEDFFQLCHTKRQLTRWVGNLPYNISVPILLRLMDAYPLVQDATFLVQKEVALRAAAQVGQRHYGRLAIMLQCVFEVSVVLDVPPEAFDPAPRVDSAVVVMRPLQSPHLMYLQQPNFTDIVQRAFGQRRKMLRKIFQGIMTDLDWQTLEIDSSLRPEMITAEDFYKIAYFIDKTSLL